MPGVLEKPRRHQKGHRIPGCVQERGVAQAEYLIGNHGHQIPGGGERLRIFLLYAGGAICQGNLNRHLGQASSRRTHADSVRGDIETAVIGCKSLYGDSDKIGVIPAAIHHVPVVRGKLNGRQRKPDSRRILKRVASGNEDGLPDLDESTIQKVALRKHGYRSIGIVFVRGLPDLRMQVEALNVKEPVTLRRGAGDFVQYDSLLAVIFSPAGSDVHAAITGYVGEFREGELDETVAHSGGHGFLSQHGPDLPAEPGGGGIVAGLTG